MLSNPKDYAEARKWEESRAIARHEGAMEAFQEMAEHLEKGKPRFLATYTQRDGENEYNCWVFIRAKDIDEASKKLKDWLTTFYDDGHWTNDVYYSHDGTLAVCEAAIEEVTEPQEAIMQKIEIIE